LPIRTEIRFLDVVIARDLAVQRQFADPKNLADAPAERNRPCIVAVRLPVGGDDGRGNEVPTAVEVVVNEVLPGKEIDIFINGTDGLDVAEQ
jgi:hypothetical protein